MRKLTRSKFVLAVEEGHPTFMGLINPKDASDRWIFNQLRGNVYQFKDRQAYGKGLRLWKRYRSNCRRGIWDEWILGRYQGLIEPLGYDAKAALPETALETIRRDYANDHSVEKLASDWDKSIDAIKRIVGIRKDKPRCTEVSESIKQGVSESLSTRPCRVVPQSIEVGL